MFNRTLEVKVVKTKKNENETPDQNGYETPFAYKAAVVANHCERVVEKIGSAIVTYIVVDTIRQVMIEKARR